MDGPSFDIMTRALVTRITRRSVFPVAFSGLVSWQLLPVSHRKAGDRCRSTGRHCTMRQECCAGSACINRRCQAIDICGVIACPAEQYCCNPSCGICTPTGDGCTQELCT